MRYIGPSYSLNLSHFQFDHMSESVYPSLQAYIFAKCKERSSFDNGQAN